MASINVELNYLTVDEALAVFAALAGTVDNHDVDVAEVGEFAETQAASAANFASSKDQSLTAFQKLLVELDHPKHALRTVRNLIEKTGYDSQDEIEDDLTAADIDYVVKSRRSNGEALIGLASRN